MFSVAKPAGSLQNSLPGWVRTRQSCAEPKQEIVHSVANTTRTVSFQEENLLHFPLFHTLLRIMRRREKRQKKVWSSSSLSFVVLGVNLIDIKNIRPLFCAKTRANIWGCYYSRSSTSYLCPFQFDISGQLSGQNLCRLN